MNERERMRSVLAERVMGWTEFPHLHGSSDWTTHDGKGHHVVVMDFDRWQPDTDWEQAGDVIEAMRAEGWGFQLHCGIDRPARAVFWHLDNLNRNYCGEGEICYAVSLAAWAACRALEATDGVS